MAKPSKVKPDVDASIIWNQNQLHPNLPSVFMRKMILEQSSNFRDHPNNITITDKIFHHNSKKNQMIKAIDNLGFRPESVDSDEDAEESSKISENTCYVLALFDVAYWLFLCPWKLRYDPDQKVYVKSEPRLVRKVFIIVLHISTHSGSPRNANNIILLAIPTVFEFPRLYSASKLLVQKSFQYNVWFKCGQAVQLVTEIQGFFQLYSSTKKNEQRKYYDCNKTKVYTFALIILFVYIFLASIFAIVVSLIQADLTQFHFRGIIECSAKLWSGQLQRLLQS